MNSIVRIFSATKIVLLVWTLGLLALGCAARPASAAATNTLDLSGTWLMHTGDNGAWVQPAASEADWQSVQLPGVPVNPGFTWYRKHVVIPSDWESDSTMEQYKRLYLHLGALHGAAEIYLNGVGVNRVGKLPATAAGKGFQAIQPSGDVTVLLPAYAPDTGKSLWNWGADNVIAMRVYDIQEGANPSSGPLELDLPSQTQLYPLTISQAQPNQLYGTGNPIKYKLTFSNNTDKPTPLSWSADLLDDKGHRLPGYTPAETTGTLDPSSSSTYSSELSFGDTPGFFTFVINSKIGGQPLAAKQFVAGWNASKIRSDETVQPGFTDFWSAVQSAADGKPLNASVNKDAAASTSSVTVYRLRYDGINGKPALAWLSVPANAQSNPVAIVHIPAYRQDPIHASVDLASRGYVVLDLLTTAADYTSGNANQDYFTAGIESAGTYIFRTIAGNAIRGVRLLRSGKVTGVSGTPRVVLWGESAGGGLALDLAGLLKSDVSAVVAISPYFSDMADTLSSVQGANDPFDTYVTSHPGSRTTVNHTLSFFDTVHFAPKITAPVFFALGLKDKVAPPYSEFAAINALPAASQNTVDVEPDSGHIPPASRSKALDWLGSRMH